MKKLNTNYNQKPVFRFGQDGANATLQGALARGTFRVEVGIFPPRIFRKGLCCTECLMKAIQRFHLQNGDTNDRCRARKFSTHINDTRVEKETWRAALQPQA